MKNKQFYFNGAFRQQLILARKLKRNPHITRKVSWWFSLPRLRVTSSIGGVSYGFRTS